MVSIAIHEALTVETQIQLCSSQLNVANLTSKMQLASMLFISCNIPHLAHQRGQHRIQWSMLRKRIFPHWLQANMANLQSAPHNVIIKRISTRAPWKQIGSEHLNHCVACDPNRGLRGRYDEKHTVDRSKRKRYGSSITWMERPLWQESKLKTQRQWLSMSRKISEMLKRRERRPVILSQHLRICWMPSGIVWAIMQVPMMATMGNARMIMKMMQRWASWVKMTNLAGWWVQSPKWFSITCGIFGTTSWSLLNWLNQDEQTKPTTSGREIICTGRPNRRCWHSSNHNQKMMQLHLHQQHLESVWRIWKASAEVLAMGPGNPPVVQIWTGKPVQFSSRPFQKHDPHLHVGQNTAPNPSTHGSRLVWLDLSGPVSWCAFQVVLFLVVFKYPTVNREIIMMAHRCSFWMYWLPSWSKKVDKRSLPLPGNERQWRVNDFRSCILHNRSGHWLQIVITEVLASCIGQSRSDTLPAPSWKWASDECQRLKVSYLG